ncbi:MAG TPA: ribonuclease III [Rubricoccaceae bacterium]|jgi:ribonuclease-3
MAPDGTFRRSARLMRSWFGGLRRSVRRGVPFASGDGTAEALPQAPPEAPRATVQTVDPPAATATAPPADEVTARGVSRRAVEALVGMPVGPLDLYEHALRHRSLFRGLPTDGTESNERLEFLGDAVLGAVVAEALFTAFPDRDEGLLTRTRATLVNGKALAGYAEALGLGPLLLLSDNMDSAAGRANTTILADAFEAILGAVYLDLGFDAARRFVLRVLDAHASVQDAAQDRSNHKSRLLELVQSRGLAQPVYSVVSEEGPSHDRRFTVAAVVDGVDCGQGTAKSKKEAEQEAAKQALATLRRFEKEA